MIASGMLALFESKVDRVLLTLGALLSVSAGYLLMKQSQDSEFLGQSPSIGIIRTPFEVNQRHSRSFAWQKIDKESKLYLKDMIYVPPKGTAEVALNSEEKLTLDPDSLVEFDSISSDQFNIILMQGAAKLVSSQGIPKSILTAPKEMEVQIPEVEKPRLPQFFLDPKSWSRSQNELIQSLTEQRKGLKLLSENKIKFKELVLSSLMDYELELFSPQVIDSGNSKLWYKFSWVSIPLSGTTYEIEVSRNKDFKPAIRHETQQPFLEIQFLEGGTHFWKVIAKNGREKNASAFKTITVPSIEEGKLPVVREEE